MSVQSVPPVPALLEVSSDYQSRRGAEFAEIFRRNAAANENVQRGNSSGDLDKLVRRGWVACAAAGYDDSVGAEKVGSLGGLGYADVGGDSVGRVLLFDVGEYFYLISTNLSSIPTFNDSMYLKSIKISNVFLRGNKLLRT